MSDIDELAQLRDFGSALRDYLTTLTPPPECATAASELAGLAGELIAEADGPLRIGVVGEFSSGKSLLLGVLLNDPCLLPTSPHPTTGNVTELRFSRDDGSHDTDNHDTDSHDTDSHDTDSHSTASRNAEIRYFSREDLATLNGRLLDELRATAARLHIPEPGDVATPGGDDAALTTWCAQLWRSPDPAARKLIRELLYTRAAAARGAALLGTTRFVDRDRLKDILQIPRVNDPDTFPEVPAPGWTVTGAGHPAWAFPLIDRVCLNVHVPSGVWDLAALPPGCEFVLLDFPGVGGGLTHVRDLYLTQRGLRDVHTVLVMVDSEKPGGRAADAFYGFLRELTAHNDHNDDPGTSQEAIEEPLASRLLYCATRFDLLKPPGEENATPGGITEQALLSQSEPLWTLLQSGHRPGASSMSAMLSSVTAIAAAGLTPVPPDLDLAHHADNALAQARRWRAIADALTEGGTGRDLASALRDYAQDGGIARLRALLERHVTDHGLGQRLSRMRELVAVIEQHKAALVVSLLSHTSSRGTAADDPAVAASRLLNSLSSYNSRYQRLLPRLRDPAMIEVSPRWSLRDDVAQRAAQLVIEWKQWADILACVEDDVIVPPSDAGHDVDDEDEYGLPPIRRQEQHVPQTTEDFTAVFGATCRELREYAQERAFEGLRGWLGQRHIDGLELRRQVDRTISPEAWKRLAGNRSLESIGVAIDELLEPDRLLKATVGHVTKQLQQENGNGQQQSAPDFTKRFPLRRDQVLPWSAEAAGDETSRHLVRMLRMRSVFVASVTEIALSDLDDLQYRIYDRLRRLNRRVELPGNAQHEAFVAAVAGEDRTGRRTFTDHATALDAIRPPSAGWETWRA